MTSPFTRALLATIVLTLCLAGCGGSSGDCDECPAGTPRMAVQNAAGVDLDQQTLDLGTSVAGTIGTPYDVYVQNTGSAVLRGPGGGDITVTLSGADAAHFTVAPTTIAALQPGTSASVTLELSPGAAQTAGELTAQVEVTGNDAVNPTTTFDLSGQVPAPEIASVEPASGSTFGGGSVTITGKGIQSSATVQFGGVPATSVSVSGDGTQITCTPAAAAVGLADVVVTNGNTDVTTQVAGYEYMPVCIVARADASDVRQLYAVLPSGAATERQLTQFATDDTLLVTGTVGEYVVFSRTIASDTEYYSIHVVTGAVTQITNRANTRSRSFYGFTGEAVPRLLIGEETSTAIWEIYSARVDGSDAGGAGAVHVSGLDVKVSTLSSSFAVLITKETLPRIVFVNDANNHSYCARVDGSDSASPVQLVSSGSTNYLYAVTDQALSGESAPRLVYRAASSGYQLFSVLVDGTQGSPTQLTITGSPLATYRALTKEATPRVVFYRDDASVRHLFSMPIDQTETGNIRKLSTGTNPVAVVAEHQIGGPLGTATVPHVCYTQSDGTRDQVYSVLVDGSAAPLDLSQSTSTGAGFEGILPGSPDRVFFAETDALGNKQIHIRNIDATGSSTQITSGDDAGGTEGSWLYGVVGGRYTVTRRMEASAPGTTQQVFAWDLTAGTEAQLTAWYPVDNSIDLPYPGPYFVAPTTNRYAFIHRTTGSVTQFFAVLADGTAAPVQLTNSLNSSTLEGVLFR